jgi:hypothetical protein
MARVIVMLVVQLGAYCEDDSAGSDAAGGRSKQYATKLEWPTTTSRIQPIRLTFPTTKISTVHKSKRQRSPPVYLSPLHRPLATVAMNK